MGRGPAKPKARAKLPVARKSLRDQGSTVRDLEKCLAAAVEREAKARIRGARAADGDRRHPARHQLVADRRAAGLRHHRQKRCPALPRRHGVGVAH